LTLPLPYPPIYAGLAGSFDALLEKGATEGELEKRRKKKAAAGAYGLFAASTRAPL
jgi:hypothetical protein